MKKFEQRYALDSGTHPKLLVDLWDVEGLVKTGQNEAALRMLETLINNVRYSAIIEEYTIMGD